MDISDEQTNHHMLYGDVKSRTLDRLRLVSMTNVLLVNEPQTWKLDFRNISEETITLKSFV